MRVGGGVTHFVAWEEIASAYIETSTGKRFLCLVPKDVAGFLARQPGWKRWTMQQNVGLIGVPITVPAH